MLSLSSCNSTHQCNILQERVVLDFGSIRVSRGASIAPAIISFHFKKSKPNKFLRNNPHAVSECPPDTKCTILRLQRFRTSGHGCNL